MRIDILYPRLPPVPDAIGEHNTLLASALNRRGVRVRMLHASVGDPDPVSGAETVRLRRGRRGMLTGLEPALKENRTDWLIAEYNPFSYGRYGLNPLLPMALAHARRAAPETRQALFIHEGFVPTRGLKSAVMGFGQRQQLRAVGHGQDLVITSVEVWIEQFSDLFPSTTVRMIPVGSNVPLSTSVREEARRSLDLARDRVVLAAFGGLATGRALPLLRQALTAVDDPEVTIIYAGPSGDVFAHLVTGLRMRAVNLGWALSSRVALALAAADVGLAPFSEGVSERRGSFLAMLQHGLATVTTLGEHTGPGLRQAASNGAFVLSDPTPEQFSRSVRALISEVDRRHRMGARARVYYSQRHDWPVLADQYLQLMAPERAMPCPR